MSDNPNQGYYQQVPENPQYPRQPPPPPPGQPYYNAQPAYSNQQPTYPNYQPGYPNQQPYIAYQNPQQNPYQNEQYVYDPIQQEQIIRARRRRLFAPMICIFIALLFFFLFII